MDATGLSDAALEAILNDVAARSPRTAPMRKVGGLGCHGGLRGR